MKTTNLFVELIIIGVGAFSWCLLLSLAMFGTDWFPTERFFSATALIPIMSITYLLGIVTDRLADMIFAPISNRQKHAYFPDRTGRDDEGVVRTIDGKEDYFMCRREILMRSSRLSELIEYSRGRLRICRGWVFNIPFIILTANYFIWQQPANPTNPWRLKLCLTLTIGLGLLAIAAYLSWSRLNRTGYRKVKHQAAYLVAQNLKD